MIYLLLFVLLLSFELLYFRIAKQFKIVDKPNARSSHKRCTLLGGGVVIYFGGLLYFLFFGQQYLWFFIGLSLISLISFADDIKSMSFKLRLLVHFVAILFLFYQLGLFQYPMYILVFVLILSIGILNAYNFMDGINGITGAYSIVLISIIWYINNYLISFIDNNFLYTIFLALLIFNFFNFRKKAKCFAGDVGALSIAYILIFLIAMLIFKTSDFSYIIILLVYGIDTVLTIIHRIILKENIFHAHRKHIFQLMANELKIPHLLVSGFYAMLQLIIVMGYFWFKSYSYLYLIIVSAILTIAYIAFKMKYYKLHAANLKKE